MKISSPYNYNYEEQRYYVEHCPCIVEPDQSLSIREMIDRASRGLLSDITPLEDRNFYTSVPSTEGELDDDWNDVPLGLHDIAEAELASREASAFINSLNNHMHPITGKMRPDFVEGVTPDTPIEDDVSDT